MAYYLREQAITWTNIDLSSSRIYTRILFSWIKKRVLHSVGMSRVDTRPLETDRPIVLPFLWTRLDGQRNDEYPMPISVKMTHQPSWTQIKTLYLIPIKPLRKLMLTPLWYKYNDSMCGVTHLRAIGTGALTKYIYKYRLKTEARNGSRGEIFLRNKGLFSFCSVVWNVEEDKPLNHGAP